MARVTSAEGGDAAVCGRPRGRLVEEALDLLERHRIEGTGLLRDFQHVPPRRQVVELDADLLHQVGAVGEDVVVEEDEAVIDRGRLHPAGRAEVDLAAPVGRQILDEERLRTVDHLALDLRVAAKPFGFLRTYCIGRLKRSAIQAANGMPAVSPPATWVICS